MVILDKDDRLVAEGARCESFTYADNAGMADATPSLYQSNGGLVLKTETFEPAEYVSLSIECASGFVRVTPVSEHLAVIT